MPDPLTQHKEVESDFSKRSREAFNRRKNKD
jgi:hypothetical protein